MWLFLALIMCQAAIIQKQPFIVVPQNKYFQKFRNIHKETVVSESLFNKVAGLKICRFIKKETPTQVFSYEYCEIFKDSFFYIRPLVTVYQLVWIMTGNLVVSSAVDWEVFWNVLKQINSNRSLPKTLWSDVSFPSVL